MGSFSETNGYNIDPTVGGLVWVRRKNGSWWPGQILCPDELPKSCLLSPRRAGTPVQLLGREDASVEWFNLEKSKRVKPFRCGEYDECIEKTKATTFTCKTSLKYAHREDAILQALELENSQLSKTNDPDTTSHTDKHGNISDKVNGLDFLNDSEDDGTEGSTKRMRGLEDIGIGGANSSFKKKRSRVVHIHDILKRKNHCHLLTKVLKKTEMVAVSLTCEEVTGLNGSGFSNDNVSHSTDNDANDRKLNDNEHSSDLELLENDDSSGRLFDVPFVQEEMHTAGSSPALVPETGWVGVGSQSAQTSLAETVSVEPDEFQEPGSISSKWQNKGKRNSRNKNKTKPMQKILDPDDELKKVTNLVNLTATQQSMPIRHPRSKKADTGILYDVNIVVKAGHCTQHLTYISLVSKFTGQPVTGHSLEVEVLNDTLFDLSLNSSECVTSSGQLRGVNKDVEMVPGHSKKRRKKGLLSNKKTRRLSSLTSSKKPSEIGMVEKVDLACVPLKVVFGRIYAALGISSAVAAPDL